MRATTLHRTWKEKRKKETEGRRREDLYDLSLSLSLSLSCYFIKVHLVFLYKEGKSRKSAGRSLELARPRACHLSPVSSSLSFILIFFTIRVNRNPVICEQGTQTKTTGYYTNTAGLNMPTKQMLPCQQGRPGYNTNNGNVTSISRAAVKAACRGLTSDQVDGHVEDLEFFPYCSSTQRKANASVHTKVWHFPNRPLLKCLGRQSVVLTT